MKRSFIGISVLIFSAGLLFLFLGKTNTNNPKKENYANSQISGRTVQDIMMERIRKKRDKDLTDKLKFDNPDIYAEYHLGIRTRSSEKHPGYVQGNRINQLKRAKSNPNYLAKRALRTSALEWKERGPANVPGRTRGLLPLPSQPQEIWLAGSVGGGIWKTTDAGNSWQNKTPDLPSLAISWLALCESQPEIVYAATGEAIGGSVGLSGSGIFKSIDGGDSWSQLASTNGKPDFNTINRIIVDPNDPDIVLFCYSQGEWEPEFKSGIYKTIDGGQSWNKVYEADSWVFQIIANPDNFNTLYASKWAKGVAKSVDGGETWFDSSLGFNKVFGRIELAIAPSDTSRLYGSVQGDLSGSGADLYASYDAGANWSFINQKYDKQAVDFLRSQGDYDNTIAVNPFVEDEVYYGGVNLWRTRMNEGESEVLLPVITFKVSSDTLSFWDFINFGADYNNGKLELGTNVAGSEIVDVEVRSGPGKFQLAHRFTVGKQGSGVPDNEYVYNDYVEIPFEVWDLTNDRQLMVSFRDQQEDSVYNLIYVNTQDGNTENHSREYFYIHSVAYDVAPNSIIAQTSGDNIGHQYKLLYFYWPVLRAGYTWDDENLEADTITIDYDLVPVKERSGTMTPVSDAYADFLDLNPAYDDEGNLFDFHPDHHNLVMIPVSSADSTFMILNSNDGGVYISDPDSIPGTTDGSWSFAGSGFNTGQFYSAAKKPGEHQYMGGLQDNGTWRSPSGEDATFTTDYESLFGGDGFDVLWNYENPAKLLISLYQNRFQRSENNGRTWVNSSVGISGVSPFFSKLASSNSNPNTVFTVSSDGVFKSENFGEKWILSPITEKWGFSNFIDIKVSLSNHDIIWAGSGMSEGLSMHVSKNGGETFTATTSFTDVELGFISGLATHPFEDSTAYALFSFAGGPKILRTTDLGNSWEDISGFGTNSISDNGFPDVAVYSLLVRPDNPTILWAGTEIGIFESTDNGVSWSFLEGGLGAASIWEMNVMDDQVVIATHGRGIFTATLTEVQEVVIVPVIVGAGTTVKGDFKIEFDFKSAYDSSFISLNGNTELLFKATEKDIYTTLFTSLTPNDSINVELVCYRKGKKYEAISLLTSHYQTNDPVETYIQDFNSGTNDFTGGGFEIMAYNGFDDFAIHSKHPYEEGTGFKRDQINYLFNLKTPIIVSSRNSEIEYENIAIVETGEIGSRYPQEDFYDYVVFEGSKDGLSWKPISDPYDARKDTKWLNAYNSKLDGDKSMFAKHHVLLRNYFAIEDTVLLRFRLFSDPLTVGWGWAIDNLSIQPPITAINQAIELKQNAINIYPNPSSNVATLDYVLQKESKVQLFMMDIRGNMIYEEQLGDKIKGAHELQIKTSSLRKGLYILQLRIGSDISTIKLHVN